MLKEKGLKRCWLKIILMNQTVMNDKYKKMLETVIGATILGINLEEHYKTLINSKEHDQQSSDESNNSSEPMAEPEPKKRKGRGITAPHRHRADGTYDSRPNDPDYFRKYYQERTLRDIPCPNCGCNIKDATRKARHMRTKKCMNFNKALLNDPPTEC